MEVAQHSLNGISKLSLNPGPTVPVGLGQEQRQSEQRLTPTAALVEPCVPRPPWDLLGDKEQLLAEGELRRAAFPPAGGCGHTQSQRRHREGAEGPRPASPAELPGQRSCNSRDTSAPEGGSAWGTDPEEHGEGNLRRRRRLRGQRPLTPSAGLPERAGSGRAEAEGAGGAAGPGGRDEGGTRLRAPPRAALRRGGGCRAGSRDTGTAVLSAWQCGPEAASRAPGTSPAMPALQCCWWDADTSRWDSPKPSRPTELTQDDWGTSQM